MQAWRVELTFDGTRLAGRSCGTNSGTQDLSLPPTVSMRASRVPGLCGWALAEEIAAMLALFSQDMAQDARHMKEELAQLSLWQ